ncbi:MAG: AIR synthase-related protein [Saprospiraceae bacterium]|nr:AIR synthase-related protein [Saprospiraceae bacterium]MDW8484753.1 AIR synthase-related protein [Saprospiraceae bacterium]
MPTQNSSKYDQRGVSASKTDVHEAIHGLDKGLYPEAFCKILPDVAAGDPGYCNLLHADTAGTKAVLAYLYWRETNDLSVWAGIAQDAIVMNLDDIACTGCTDNILLSNTIARNRRLIPGAVLKALIEGAAEFVAKMRRWGINLHLAGGETADVGDLVRTIDVGFTAFARMPRAKIIVNAIQPGDVVVGLASFGQAVYEEQYNSGIGSNGLTAARHDVLKKTYAEQYPESYDPAIPPDLVYCGHYQLTETLNVEDKPTTIGQLLLSPTRTYAPVLRLFFERHRPDVHGLIHCTGGGQTKVLKFLHNVRVVKDNLFEVPPVFQLIQASGQTAWAEMYQVFNMGHRMEVYTSPQAAKSLLDIAEDFGIRAQVVGRVEACSKPCVELHTPFGTFHYIAD